jgi:hypothetical protein
MIGRRTRFIRDLRGVPLTIALVPNAGHVGKTQALSLFRATTQSSSNRTVNGLGHIAFCRAGDSLFVFEGTKSVLSVEIGGPACAQDEALAGYVLPHVK